MREIEAAHAAPRPHGEVFGQLYAGVLLPVEELPEGAFLSVVRARGIARGRSDSAILFVDEVLVGKLLVRAVTPFFTNAFVQVFGKGLGQTIGQRLGHDRVVV